MQREYRLARILNKNSRKSPTRALRPNGVREKEIGNAVCATWQTGHQFRFLSSLTLSHKPCQCARIALISGRERRTIGGNILLTNGGSNPGLWRLDQTSNGFLRSIFLSAPSSLGFILCTISLPEPLDGLERLGVITCRNSSQV
jgi:hypothetical protein